MAETIIPLTLLALFIGYAKLQQGKGQPLSTKKGKQQFAVGIVWILAMLTAGTYSALSSGLSKSQQYILLFMVFGGTIAVLVGAGIAALRNKVTRKHEKQDSRKHSS